MNKTNLEWNVIRFNINHHQVEPFNIFNHGSFNDDVIKNFQKNKDDKTKFLEELRSDAMYYFWGKSEYEVVVHPWIGGRDGDEKKIDIFYQLCNNWNLFSEYVWNYLYSAYKLNRWAVVGFDYDKALELIQTIELLCEKDIVKRRKSKTGGICTYFADGTTLRWVPARESSRGQRYNKMWCNKNIDKKILNCVIMPCYRGKKEDIIWI